MDEKTHLPTPRKLRKSREKGNVPFSQLLASALLLGGSFLILKGLSSLLGKRLLEMMQTIFSMGLQVDITTVISNATRLLIWPMLWFFLGTWMLAIGVHFLQKGWIWKKEKEKGPFFSLQTFKGGSGRVCFSFLILLGLIGVGGIAFSTLKQKGLKMMNLQSQYQGGFLFDTLINMALGATAILLIIGIADYFYNWRRFLRQQMMTNEEVKEEKKDAEGNRHFFRRH